ncbi:MAG TPA: endonuclease VII domain-containing protein [Mesorhizobium sp.]|jgi:hypothetical protein|nr:endonuclease VII domain-containing protein [Mesorhizobium sp.]
MASAKSITRKQRYAQDPEYRKKARAESRRDYELRRRYGISAADYAAMLARQGGRCAVCRRKPEPGRRLEVDHCHVTGQARGLLCHRCNTMLGMGDDDPRRLRPAVAYLEAAEGCAGSG